MNVEETVALEVPPFALGVVEQEAIFDDEESLRRGGSESNVQTQCGVVRHQENITHQTKISYGLAPLAELILVFTVYL